MHVLCLSQFTHGRRAWAALLVCLAVWRCGRLRRRERVRVPLRTVRLVCACTAACTRLLAAD